jgi:phosphate transport system permease protein
MPISFFEQGNSLPSRIINEFTETTTPLHMSALITLGFILFAISFVFQAGVHLWLKRLNWRRNRKNPWLYGEPS